MPPRLDPQRFFNRWPRRARRLAGAGAGPARPCRRAVSPGDGMLVTWIGHATVLVQTAGPQHPHRSDLVGARLAFLVHRPEARARAGRAVRGSAEDRSRPDQPQSLRPYGPADAAAALGARPAADRHQPRQRHDPARARASRRSRATGADACRSARGIEVIVERNHHWGSRWGTDRNRALWSAFTVRLPGGNIFFAGDTGWGDGSWVREAARHGPVPARRSCRSAPICRATSCRTTMSIRRKRCASSTALNPDARARRPLGHVPAHLRADRRRRAKRSPRCARARHIAPDRFVATEAGPRTFRAVGAGTMSCSAFGPDPVAQRRFHPHRLAVGRQGQAARGRSEISASAT